jgi:hypothetical protein
VIGRRSERRFLTADINLAGKHNSGSFGPSTLKVWLAKMVVLTTLGGGYGAAIENRRQEGRGDTAQGKLNKGPQTHQDQGQS